MCIRVSAELKLKVQRVSSHLPCAQSGLGHLAKGTHTLTNTHMAEHKSSRCKNFPLKKSCAKEPPFIDLFLQLFVRVCVCVCVCVHVPICGKCITFLFSVLPRLTHFYLHVHLFGQHMSSFFPWNVKVRAASNRAWVSRSSWEVISFILPTLSTSNDRFPTFEYSTPPLKTFGHCYGRRSTGVTNNFNDGSLLLAVWNWSSRD